MPGTLNRCATFGIYLLIAFPTSVTGATRLGAAADFALLGAAAVTNSGASAVRGDMGVSPGVSMTGLDTVAHNGGVHANDVVAVTAQGAAGSAYDSLSALAFDVDLSGTDLGSLGSLPPGVYRFATAAELTGALILDFAGHQAQPFVFQIGTALTTIAASQLTVINGSADSAIYWLVGSSATLGAGSTFVGNVIADQSITLADGARILCGRGLALHGALTMIANLVSNDCAAGDLGSGLGDFGSHGYDGFGNGGVSTAPEPGTWAMLLTGFGAVGGLARRRRQAAHSSRL